MADESPIQNDNYTDKSVILVSRNQNEPLPVQLQDGKAIVGDSAVNSGVAQVAVPVPDGNVAHFLNGLGAWTTPAGGGGGGITPADDRGAAIGSSDSFTASTSAHSILIGTITQPVSGDPVPFASIVGDPDTAEMHLDAGVYAWDVTISVTAAAVRTVSISLNGSSLAGTGNGSTTFPIVTGGSMSLSGVIQVLDDIDDFTLDVSVSSGTVSVSNPIANLTKLS